MDAIRQIRYLTPAIFLVLSLLLGARIDSDQQNGVRALWRDVVTSTSPPATTPPQAAPGLLETPSTGGMTGPATVALVTMLATGTAVVLAGGVFIGALAHLLLGVAALIARPVFCVIDRNKAEETKHVVYWEIFQTRGYFRRIWPLCAPYNAPDPGRGVKEPDERFYYNAVVTFDHENLARHAPGLHEWLVRRWNWFNVTANSTVALGLSLAIGRCGLGIELARAWVWPVTAMMVVLVINAGIAWVQVQRMHEFQSHRP